jgi:predicted ATPase
MQIKMRNFGPIKAFDFDLEKNWVVIFGKNNCGKSYGIYLVYLLIKAVLTSQNSWVVGTRDDKRLQQKFLAEFQQAFSHTFLKVDNTQSRFSNQPMRLSFATSDAELAIETIDNRWVLENASLLSTIAGELDGVKQVYYLPAARFGIYQALSSLTTPTELSNNSRTPTQKVTMNTLSEPVSDYYKGLSNITNHLVPGNQAILDIVAEIEQNLLKGEVIFDTFCQKIFYKPFDTDLVLELSLTSSMVSELAPIVCYLKYIIAFAPEKSLLFIEEPEAHLHPEAQVVVLEILAKLVKTGVKLVMACHGSSMFNHLNNLILDGTIDILTIQPLVFRNTHEGSQATPMSINRLGIDDDNFLETAEAIFNRKMEIIDTLNEAA